MSLNVMKYRCVYTVVVIIIFYCIFIYFLYICYNHIKYNHNVRRWTLSVWLPPSERWSTSQRSCRCLRRTPSPPWRCETTGTPGRATFPRRAQNFSEMSTILNDNLMDIVWANQLICSFAHTTKQGLRAKDLNSFLPRVLDICPNCNLI